MSDYVAAWKAFKESEQFRYWTRAETLGGNLARRDEFLANRIIAAFEYGWNAALASQGNQKK
jgi:hypothetical protein